MASFENKQKLVMHQNENSGPKLIPKIQDALGQKPMPKPKMTFKNLEIVFI